jgi:hypothetical protein
VEGGDVVGLLGGGVVHRAGGLEHDAADTGLPGGLEERGREAGHRGQQEDRRDALERGGQALRIRQIAGDDLGGGRQAGAGRVACERAHLSASGHELLDDGAAHGCGCRGNQNHVVSP